MGRRRLTREGQEVSYPTVHYDLLRASAEIQRAQWNTLSERLPFTIDFLRAMQTYYLRRHDAALAADIGRLINWLRAEGDVRKVMGVLHRLLQD